MSTFEISYDLHIHSCLSPCGDDSMTPLDIARFAEILELDAVALTDHNTSKNCPAFFDAAKELNIIPIAGMEITTSEEIHVVCLFSELHDAMRFDEYVSGHIFKTPNDVRIFGNQLIKNVDDETIGEIDYHLLNATDIDLYSLGGLVRSFDGIIIPAHIERSSFSLISMLGFIPDDCGFNTVEVRSKEAVENLKLQYEYLNCCKIIHNSDAHSLENISLPINKIMVKEKTAKAVLESLSGGNI